MCAVGAKAISIVATMALIAAVIALAVFHGLLGTGIASISLQAAGVLLVLWARIAFGARSFHFAANPTRGALITSGPYRYVRNPIYAAVWLITWTGIAAHWSVINAMLGLFILITLFIKIFCEEQLLRLAYREYDHYARKTARLIPFVF